MHIAYVEMLVGLIAAIVLVYLLIVGQFPIVARSLHHHYGLARRIGGHRVVLVPDPHEYFRAGADGRHHDDGHGDRQFDSRRLLRPRTAQRARRRAAAAVEAGKARIRPVLMTASAMIVGMLPMSMSNSQNAPLGRAVMGGLTVATFFTLFFVPCVYAIIYSRRAARQKDRA